MGTDLCVPNAVCCTLDNTAAVDAEVCPRFAQNRRAGLMYNLRQSA